MVVTTDLKSGKGDDSHPPISLVVKQCVLVGCCFLMLMNVLGFMAGLGVLFVDILDTFQSTRATGSLIQSVCMGIVFGTGAVASHVIRNVGAGRVCVIGGVVAASGLVGSAFAPSLPVLVFAVGIVTGLGLCTTSMVPLIIVGDMFNSRRNLALTIVSIGPGVGALVFPVLNSLLVEQFGWRGTLLILGGVVLQATPIGMLLSVLGEDIHGYNKRTNRLQVEEGPDSIDEHVDSTAKKMSGHEVDDGPRPTADGNALPGTHIIGAPYVEGAGTGEIKSIANGAEIPMSTGAFDTHVYVNTAFTDGVPCGDEVAMKACSLGNSDLKDPISCPTEHSVSQSAEAYRIKKEMLMEMTTINIETSGSNEVGSVDKNVPNFNVQNNNNATNDIISPREPENVNVSCVDEYFYDNKNPISLNTQELDRVSNRASQASFHPETYTMKGSHFEHQKFPLNSKDKNKNTPNNSRRPRNRFKTFFGSLHLEIFKDITFIILAMNVVLITAMFPSINFFLVDMTISKGFDAQTGSLLLSLIGFCNLAGRFLYLFLRPFFKVTQIMIFATLGLMISLSVLLLAWADTLPFLLAAVVCYGIPFGAVSVSYPSLMFEIAGAQRYAMAVGYSETLSGVGALIGGPIAGSLKDWTESYNSVVYGATAAGLLCSLSFYAVLIDRRCRESK